VRSPGRIARTQDANRLTEHASVAPEATRFTARPPNRLPSADRVDAREHDFSGTQLRAKSVTDGIDLNRVIDLEHSQTRGLDFGEPDFRVSVALRRYVRPFAAACMSNRIPQAAGRPIWLPSAGPSSGRLNSAAQPWRPTWLGSLNIG
jgi:hypothetical protein